MLTPELSSELAAASINAASRIIAAEPQQLHGKSVADKARLILDLSRAIYLGAVESTSGGAKAPTPGQVRPKSK